MRPRTPENQDLVVAEASGIKDLKDPQGQEAPGKHWEPLDTRISGVLPRAAGGMSVEQASLFGRREGQGGLQNLGLLLGRLIAR